LAPKRLDKCCAENSAVLGVGWGLGEIVVDWCVGVIYCQNKYLFTLAMRQF
jgi:hypothetical protein